MANTMERTVTNVVERRNELLDAMSALKRNVGANTTWYTNSTLLIDCEMDGKRVNMNIVDMLNVAGIAGINVMMLGKGGVGKTQLTKHWMEAVFGPEDQKWGYVCANPELSKESFVDVNFQAMQNGKLSQAIEGNIKSFITGAGGVIDEYNRTPEAAIAFLHSLLEGPGGVVNFDGGVTVKTGVDEGNGKRYRITIALMNQGLEFTGTFATDAATIDRFGLIIPTTAMMPGMQDQYMIGMQNQLQGSSGLERQDHIAADSTRELFMLHEAAKAMRVDGKVGFFFSYLGTKDNCYKMPRGVKAEGFNSTDTCSQCHARMPHEETCGMVGAIDVRTQEYARDFAKAFALHRYLQGIGKPEVTMEDVVATAPYTMYMRLPVERRWIQEHAEGDYFYGVQKVVKELAMRFEDHFAKLSEMLPDLALNGKNGRRIREAILEDPAGWETRDVVQVHLELPRIRT